MRVLMRSPGRENRGAAAKGMFSVSEILEATEGRLILGEAAGAATGVSTDTRTLVRGDLFVALRGPQFDGHDFLTEAFERGAVGAVISVAGHRIPESGREQEARRGRFLVAVHDTLAALQGLARFHRRRFQLPVIGITGSNGKTTCKEMTAWILSRDREVLKNEGNLNNQIGVPLTLFRLNDRHRAAVVEMGINHPGELRVLAGIAEPGIGVVTNIGPTHLEGLGSLEQVAEAKSELLEALPRESGVAVLNRDDRFFPVLRAKSPSGVVSFGLSPEADVRGIGPAVRDDAGVSFRLSVDPRIIGMASGRPAPGGERLEAEIRLPLPGLHNVSNALAASAAALVLGCGIDQIRAALESFPGMTMRSQWLEWKGVRILNDAYNANPASMQAALKMLAGLKTAGRRIAVLGDMLELGEGAEEFHRSLGKEAAGVPGVRLVAVGSLARLAAEAAIASGLAGESVDVCENAEAAADVIRSKARAGDVVLVKGSRGVQLDRMIQALMEKG